MSRVCISMLNLGCNKNLVDSQNILGRLLSKKIINWNIEYISDPYNTEVHLVILNSCWFIKSWRDEMIYEIENLLNLNKKVCLVWCWLQYFMNLHNWDIPDCLKDENVFFLSWNDMLNLNIWDLLNYKSSDYFSKFSFPDNWIRAFTNIMYWYEYIKIADWCNNDCSFCIIPKIRGPLISRTIKDIVDETKTLIHYWVSEVIYIAQDVTRYWIDKYWRTKLIKLLSEVDKIDWNFQFRLLYMYPDIVTIKNLAEIKNLKKFIPYFDIPIQHASPKLLKRMKRFSDIDNIEKFLYYIINNFESKFIRTNIIVWFPWETDEDFEYLINFIKKWFFDNISIFEYHDEPLSTSFLLNNKIKQDTIRKRFNIIKQVVDELLKKNYEIRKWNDQEWYVIDINKDNVIEVRPSIHAPEIDPTDKIKINDIIWVYSDDWIVDIWKKIIYKYN